MRVNAGLPQGVGHAQGHIGHRAMHLLPGTNCSVSHVQPCPARPGLHPPPLARCGPPYLADWAWACNTPSCTHNACSHATSVSQFCRRLKRRVRARKVAQVRAQAPFCAACAKHPFARHAQGHAPDECRQWGGAELHAGTAALGPTPSASASLHARTNSPHLNKRARPRLRRRSSSRTPSLSLQLISVSKWDAHSLASRRSHTTPFPEIPFKSSLQAFTVPSSRSGTGVQA